MLETVVCKRSKPAPPTADAACIAVDEVSQRRFLCKDQSKNDWLPFAEYLAQRLAERCGLVVPACYAIVLEPAPGVTYFGSQWEGGAEDYSPGIVHKVTNKDEFSRIYAFDLLIHNVDRHMNNYLYLQLAGDTVVKAMDHSRSWWFSGWPLPSPPPEPTTATVANWAYWTMEAPWNKAAAEEIVAKWRTITREEVSALVDAAPGQWVSAERREQLLGWWESEDWTKRTDETAGVLP